MKRFREYIITTHPLRPKHRAAFVVNKALYLANGGATTQGIEKDASTAENALSKRDNTRNHSKNPRKRSHNKQATQTAKYPTCEQQHSINDCWYINTKQAPK
jgi:hypothetical protein